MTASTSTRCKAQYAGGDLYLEGHVEYEGVTEIRARGDIPEVSADPNFQQYAPDIEGSAEFDLNIRQTVGGDFETKGWVRFDRFDYGAVRAHFLILEGRVWGDPIAAQGGPQARRRGGAHRRVPDRKRQALLTGGPERVQRDRRVRRAPGTGGRSSRPAWKPTKGLPTRRRHDGARRRRLSWRGSVNNATLDPEEELSFDRILMGRGPNASKRRASGSSTDPTIFAPTSRTSTWRVADPVSGRGARLHGKVDLHFEFRGDLDRAPTIVAEGTLTDADLWDMLRSTRPT